MGLRSPRVTRSAIGPPPRPPVPAPGGDAALLGSPFAGKRPGPHLVLSPAPGFWGAAWRGAAGPGRVPGLPKQRRGRLGRVGRLHAQPCPLPAQPCRGDPGSRLHCGQGPGAGGWRDPPWGKGTPSAGSGARGPGVALTGRERGPKLERCIAGEPGQRSGMLWSTSRGSLARGPPTAAAQRRGAQPLLSRAAERGPVGVWCCRGSSVQSQRLAAPARN